jgi:hypothetical protein
VIALVSRLVVPATVPTGRVFSRKLAVFATDQDSDLALLSSAIHSSWAWHTSSIPALEDHDLVTRLHILQDRLEAQTRLMYGVA